MIAGSAFGCRQVFGLDSPIVGDGDGSIDVPSDPWRCSAASGVWSVDITSRKGAPATAGEWNALSSECHLTAGLPDHLWLMQEASGDLQDSIGAVTLLPLNAPSYANSVVGWSRRGVGTVESAADQGFVTTQLGKLDGQAQLILAYVAVLQRPTVARSLFGIGGTNDHRYVAITPGSMFQASGLTIPSITGGIDTQSTVHPIVLAHDVTNATYVVYTDQERLVGSWSAPTGMGPYVVFGSISIGAAKTRYLYAATWTGPNAVLGDADVKGLLESLGWTVTGY
jgi:hypothetical protein